MSEITIGIVFFVLGFYPSPSPFGDRERGSRADLPAVTADVGVPS